MNTIETALIAVAEKPEETPEQKAGRIKALVNRGAAIGKEITTLETELKTIEKDLKALGKGRYEGDEAHCLVIESSAGKTTYKIPDDPASFLRAKALAGKHLRTLFDRIVLLIPCKGFELIAPKVLTPARSRDLTELLSVPGRAGNTYTKWG